ncbi:DUF2970 domain-containing protein [Pseudoalteromonas xiamenensis]|uniref:DUF2970 domain-containing protein n=1 Tax=Pseudoalteromonas xiamenensis TaxID=882626 RepID=UPI0027E4C2F1|nr:DUF2970 domain-containing protein [Pseudoalteromonas xiamenensis]WMN58822.1 DUF2970 domain-containing protein [Pseudoalteromonas xiamenensis]
MRWLSVLQSVLAAMFGVQSETKRQRDFHQPRPLPYIVIGVILVVLFIIVLLALVNLITPTAD